MKIADNGLLDALCGEYLLGTLRGAARRRFERALRDEPRVAQRLRHFQGIFTPRYSTMSEEQPSERVWSRLQRELGLERYRRAPWYRSSAFRLGWAAAAVAALALGIALYVLRPSQDLPVPPEASRPHPIARLAGKEDMPQIIALLSRDGLTLELRAALPAPPPGPSKSYELWLLPAGGGAPVSISVLGNLSARFALPPTLVGQLGAGAKLAVSVEPAGGSPTGAPTGPVILVGEIAA